MEIKYRVVYGIVVGMFWRLGGGSVGVGTGGEAHDLLLDAAAWQVHLAERVHAGDLVALGGHVDGLAVGAHQLGNVEGANAREDAAVLAEHLGAQDGKIDAGGAQNMGDLSLGHLGHGDAAGA